MADIKWRDQIPKHDCPRALSDRWHWGIVAIAAQFRWTYHVIRMEEYTGFQKDFSTASWLGTRGPMVDNSNATKKLYIPTWSRVETRASDRPAWRSTCREAPVAFEYNRINQLEEKRRRRKLQPSATADCSMCDICRRKCGSRIGLFSHRRVHRWRDSSYRRLSPYKKPFQATPRLTHAILKIILRWFVYNLNYNLKLFIWACPTKVIQFFWSRIPTHIIKIRNVVNL